MVKIHDDAIAKLLRLPCIILIRWHLFPIADQCSTKSEDKFHVSIFYLLLAKKERDGTRYANPTKKMKLRSRKSGNDKRQIDQEVPFEYQANHSRWVSD